MKATSKGSDQTVRMRRLVRGFAGRTYHIVGNLMHWLKYVYVSVCVGGGGGHVRILLNSIQNYKTISRTPPL